MPHCDDETRFRQVWLCSTALPFAVRTGFLPGQSVDAQSPRHVWTSRMAWTLILVAFEALFLGPVIQTQVFGQQPDTAAKIYAQAAKSVLVILVKSPSGQVVAQGTGFLIEGGKIVTNEHVIKGGTVVVDLGGARIPATVERIDNLNDIAILTTSAEISAEPLLFVEKTPPPGSSVFAIGNPRGLEKSISSGVVAAMRQVGTRELIQITTPVSPGSSGGPVFDVSGKVVGVTVSSIEDGQNLNFAVPASAVVTLLRGKPLNDQADVPSLIKTAESLVNKRKEMQYSTESDSPYQRLGNQIRETLSAAISRAGKADVELLIRISKELQESFDSADLADIVVDAVDHAAQLRASSETSLALAKALSWKGVLTADLELLGRSEKVARQAVSLAKQPSADLYFTLGDILEMRESHLEADTTLRRALELNLGAPNPEHQVDILRDLISAADGLKRPTDADKWFTALTQTGNASFFDWEGHARRLDGATRYNEAGAAWQQAASMRGGAWTDWCEAGGSFTLSGGNEDSVLSDARKCIAEGSGKPRSEARLSAAHRQVAVVLNIRGVYEEALSHAKESTVLTPDDPWAYDTQTVALLGLRRFQEAINAGKQAVRLSDGKFGIMHFHLGAAYFETENWQFARQSYEKAAELMPQEDAAAYNVAACFQRLGLFIDAAHWYQEALKRNPERTDKQELLSRIATLLR
jgi:tetratricopeptide (TPR) repeat protein